MNKIVVIHTTPVTIPAMKQLITDKTRSLSERPEIINLLDDSMLPEINRENRITEGVKYRLNTLLTMAVTTGARGILCACSSIGGLLEEGSELVGVPVCRIDAPMAETAARYGKIAVAATLLSTLKPTTDLIERNAAKAGSHPQITCRVIEGAGNLLAEGKGEEYDRIVSEQLRQLGQDHDIVVLAQASMARAIAGMTPEQKACFLTSPESGVEAFIQTVFQ